MQAEPKIVDFESDKELLRTLLNNFKSLIVFIFYSDANEKSKDLLNNFSNSVSVFGAYDNVAYFSLEASKCPETFGKFNVETTPTVIFTQTDKKVHKRYELAEDIGLIFDELSTEVQKFRQHFENEKKVWIPKVESILNSCPVIIFIKGTPQNPKCGFTRTLLQILKDHNVEFTYYDIIDDEYMRYWLREYGNWPTYPQVFVHGKFVGGLDIIKESVAKGQFGNQIPASAKTEDPEKKFKLLTSENENIAFTNAFAFESKETETFLNNKKEKLQNLYVYNVNLDSKLSEYIRNVLKQTLPFVVVKGQIQAQ